MRSTLAALISPRRIPSQLEAPSRFRRSAGFAVMAAAAFLGLSSAAHALVDISCQGGPGMTAQETPSRFEIGFMIGEGASPNPGECILPGRGLVGSEKPLLLIPKVANANLVMMAAKGGTFALKAQESPTGFRVTFIGQVNVVDNTPLTPPGGGEAGEPAQGGEGGGTGVASADCPAGSAAVQTPAGLDFLNVREKPSVDAKILSQVPNQSEVTVSGACLRAAAGLTKQKVPIAADGWCRIEAPQQGCVKAEFLVFGDGIKPGQAGFAKSKNKKH
jgi:hypothetical protein